jgi:Domain of unknown function (DUF4160)
VTPKCALPSWRCFPRFHARDANGQAKIRIDEVEVIESAMQTRQLRLVLVWAGLHQGELLTNWASGFTAVSVDPESGTARRVASPGV